MTVLNRYLIKEFGKSLLSVATVLMLIYLSSRVAALLARVAAGELPGDVVFTLLFLKLVSNLSLVLPPALFIAVLLTLGRMYRDHEITVLSACGIGYRRLYQALLLFVVPTVLLLGVLSFVVSPWAEGTAERLKKIGQQQADVSGIGAGRFKESNNGEVVFYTEGLDRERGVYQRVFIQTREGERTGVVIAKWGRERIDPETGDRFLVLEEGRRYEGNPGEADYRILRFKRYAVRIEERAPRETAVTRTDGRPTLELLRQGGSAAWAELHTRLAAPLSALLLALLALPLSYTTPRQGRYGKLFLAILIYVVYANLLVICESWLARGRLPIGVGMWWVHLGVLGLWIALQRHRNRFGRRFAASGGQA
ncbi:MAG: LPS export ABC transporter permease LptF [Gammaproteobacteria bacterium]